MSGTAPGSGTAARLAGVVLRSPALVLAGVTVLAFPILEILIFGQRARQYAHDVFDGDLPGLIAIRDDWIRNGISWWDPHLTGGNAVLAQFALPPTTPDFLLSFAIPPFAAYAITYLAMIWVAGYGMERFLRESVGLARSAALIGGILYALSFWHFIHGFAIPLLPLTLWLTDRWANASSGRARYSFALILLAVFGLYTGLLQLQLLVGLLQGIYLLVTRWGTARSIRLIGQFVAIWSAALLLFAPVLITQLVSLGQSQRSIWNLEYLYDSGLGPALGTTISLFGSAIAGVPIDSLTTGTGGYSGTFFLGGIGILLVLLGAMYPQPDRRARLLVVLGLSIPMLYLVALLVTPLQARIPVVQSFQFIRVSHLFPFALVANAAIGADLVLSGRWRDMSLKRGPVLVLAGAATLLGAQAFLAAGEAITLRSTAWLMAALAIGGGTVAGGALLVLARRTRAGMTLPTLIAVLILGLVVGERMLFTRAERGLDGGLGTYAAAMGIDPAMAYIAEQPNPDVHRTLAAGTDSNRMLVAGLYETGGYESIYPLAYHALFGALTDPYLETDPVKYQYFHEWGNRAAVFGPELDRELLDLMGVRWIYARAMAFDAPHLDETFRSATNTVYENTTVFPRAFVVTGLRTFDSPAALLAGLKSASRGELRTSGFVLAAAVPDGASPPTTVEEEPSSILRYAPDQVEVRATSRSGGFLLLTDTLAPGWTATVDGVDTPITPVDLAYRAVAVTGGVHDVVFTYRPWFTYAGLAIAGSTAVVVALWSMFALGRSTLVSRRRGGVRSSAGRTGRGPR